MPGCAAGCGSPVRLRWCDSCRCQSARYGRTQLPRHPALGMPDLQRQRWPVGGEGISRLERGPAGKRGDALAAWAERTGRGRAAGDERGGLRFAFYGRVSTEDRQYPVTFLARQQGQAAALVAGHGRVVASFATHAARPGCRPDRAAAGNRREPHLRPGHQNPAHQQRESHPRRGRLTLSAAAVSERRDITRHSTRHGQSRARVTLRAAQKCLVMGCSCVRGDLNTQPRAISPDRGNHTVRVMVLRACVSSWSLDVAQVLAAIRIVRRFCWPAIVTQGLRPGAAGRGVVDSEGGPVRPGGIMVRCAGGRPWGGRGGGRRRGLPPGAEDVSRGQSLGHVAQAGQVSSGDGSAGFDLDGEHTAVGVSRIASTSTSSLVSASVPPVAPAVRGGLAACFLAGAGSAGECAQDLAGAAGGLARVLRGAPVFVAVFGAAGRQFLMGAGD